MSKFLYGTSLVQAAAIMAPVLNIINETCALLALSTRRLSLQRSPASPSWVDDVDVLVRDHGPVFPVAVPWGMALATPWAQEIHETSGTLNSLNSKADVMEFHGMTHTTLSAGGQLGELLLLPQYEGNPASMLFTRSLSGIPGYFHGVAGTGLHNVTLEGSVTSRGAFHRFHFDRAAGQPGLNVMLDPQGLQKSALSDSQLEVKEKDQLPQQGPSSRAVHDHFYGHDYAMR